MLTAEQTAQWQNNGVLVLPNFKSAEQVAAASRRAAEIVDAFQPGADTGTFSTRDRNRVADAALLDSAEAVHCFFEEDAFDAQGRLAVPKERSINKIGHALHDLDPVFNAFSHGPELADLAADLGLRQPQVWQSQIIFKQPHIGGEVGWHQDGSFFLTTPQTVTTFWFALEDATLENGCLWVQPGGQNSPLREQYICEATDQGPRMGMGMGMGPRMGMGKRLRMQPLDTTPWPDMQHAVPLPVPAGTLVVFGGQLPHCSAPNRSPKSRLAYTLHATCGSAAYSPLNWLQRSATLPVRGFV